MTLILSDLDVLILPTMPFAATPLGDDTVVIDPLVGEEALVDVVMRYTRLASLAGLPMLQKQPDNAGEGQG